MEASTRSYSSVAAGPGVVDPVRTFVSEGRTHPFLKAKQRVGSCHASVNYDGTERAFHKHDVPTKAAAAKLEVTLHMGERDSRRWRGETSLGRPLVERRTAEILAFDPTEFTYNYRAEVLPKARPVVTDRFGHISRLVLDQKSDGHFHRTMEMPLHPELMTEGGSGPPAGPGKPRWDMTTTCLPKEKARALEALTLRAGTASKIANARLRSASPTQRRSLVTIERDRMASLRDERTSAYQLHSDDHLKTIREHQLGWSANIRNAATLHETFAPATVPPRPAPANASEKEFDEIMARQTGSHASTLRSTHRDRSTLKFRHEGVFQEVPAEVDLTGKPRRQWSCCAASDPNAKGCVAKKHDPDRWCYDG
jgi:hypothetical protein